MGQGLTNQITNSVPGMRMAAIYNRTPERAEDVYRYSGVDDVVHVDTQAAFDDAVARRARASSPRIRCCSAAPTQIDVIIDVTGSVEFGAHVFIEAFEHGKHVVMMNAEVDATIGPILQTYAQRAGVTLSACDGDEPGLQMNLVRWVAGLGLIPRVVVQHQGPPGPVPQPDDAAGVGRALGAEPGDGHVVRRRHQDQLSSRRSSPTPPGSRCCERGMSRGPGLRRLDHGRRPAATTSTSCASSAASSTTRSARPA